MRAQIYRLLGVGILLMLGGCATKEAPPEAAAGDTDAAASPEPAIRPETLLFPEYLLLPDLELQQHGLFPGSSLVGIELKTGLDLRTTWQRYADLLAAREWKTTQEEGGKQFFRLMAYRKGEKIEIRAVRGTGPTRVFILYRPRPGSAP